MIRNDRELAVAKDYAARLERLLDELRECSRPEEWPQVSSAYRLEIERMQSELRDYLAKALPAADDKSAA